MLDGYSIVILMNKNYCIEDIKYLDVLEEMKKIFENAKILKKDDEI